MTRKSESKINGKFSTDALFTFNRNIAIHHTDNIFGDRHSQSRTLNAADSGSPFSLKWLKNMLLKFLAHSYAGILDVEGISGVTFRRSALFGDSDTYSTTRRSEFKRIAQQIQHHLIQSQLITEDVLMHHVESINVKLDSLRLDVRLNDCL